MVRLGAGRGGLTALMMRHARGEPLYDIALGQRLAIDFPDDGGSSLGTLLDAAHEWENLGFQRQAANSFEEVAKSQDASQQQIDDALTERTRLDRELNDDARVQAATDELLKRWSDAGDPVGAQIKVAHLWERMGLTQKAADARSAPRSPPARTPSAAAKIALERGTIHHRLADPAGELGDYAAAAAAVAVPAIRATPTCWPRSRWPRCRVKADPVPALVEATATANPATLRRIVAIQELRQDAVGDARGGGSPVRQRSRCPRPAAVPARQPRDRGQAAAAGGREPCARRSPACLARALTERVKKRLLPRCPASNRRRRWPGCAGSRSKHGCCGSDDGLGVLGFYDHPADTADLPAEIPTWSIIGSFACDNWRTWTTDWLKSAGCDPGNPNFNTPIEGKRWRKIGNGAFNNGILDLRTYFANLNDRVESCMAMMCASVVCDKPCDVEFSCGADDALNVYVNGLEVHSDTDQRGVSPDSIHVITKFKKGRNVILLQIQQGGGGWGVQFRIVNGKAGAGIAEALHGNLLQDGTRDTNAQQLENAAMSLMRANRNGQAFAVVRALLATYGDQPELCFDCVIKIEGQAYNVGDGGMLIDLEDC